MKKTQFNEWTQLLMCNELSAIQLRVLMLILNYHNLDNWNSTAIRLLATNCGVEPNTISSATRVLEGKGLITKVISSYKKNIKATNDYLPNYERIQEMINRYINNCVSGISINDNRGISNFDNKDNISNIKKDNNIIKDTDNPILGSPITNSIEEVKNNPNVNSKPNEVINNPHSVNLDYIEELERKFYANSNIVIDPTNTTLNPSKTTKTASVPNTVNNSKRKDISSNVLTSPHSYINSNYIKALSCINPIKSNPTIMLDLQEASLRPTIFIDAMNKTIEWLQTYRNKGMNTFVANIYYNANDIIKSKDNGLNEKQTKYATDTIKQLKKAIIECGGKKILNECSPIKC